MATSDGTTPEEKTASAAGRRARTAAEQRQERAVSDDPEVLAAEIEKTREELAETLDAIADKVSPKRVAGRTKKKVGDAVKDGADSAAATVKAGAASLKGAVNDKKDSLHARGSDDGESLGEALGGVGQHPDAEVPPPVAGSTVAPPSSLRPVPTSYDAPASPRLGPPALAGAAAAVVVALFVLRRRRSRRSRWH